MPDDVGTAAWKYLSPQASVAAVLGAFSESDSNPTIAGKPYLFSGNMLVTIKGTQASAAVVSDYGGWSLPPVLGGQRFRRLRLDVWTDPTRDAAGNINVTESNTVNRCLHVFNAFHNLLQRPDMDTQTWGDMVTFSCQILTEPTPAQVSDGDSQGVGLVMGTAFYGVSFSGWTDAVA